MAKHIPAQDKRRAQRRKEDRRKKDRRSKSRRKSDKPNPLRDASPGENFR